ncbi:hypothetical protein HC256_000117 [Beauveria bassiana]|nr:hypothetical protein HC256_000117 [Beauveria bassiana]
MADPVAEAIRIIHDADFTPLEHEILADDFVQGALDPTLAAAEVLRAVNGRDHGVSVDEALLTLKRDWHELLQLVAQPAPVTDSVRQLLNLRDNGHCCVTPADYKHIHVEPSHVISPALKALWENNGNPRLFAVLTAYLTPAKVQTLKKLISPASDSMALYNVLLLSPSLGYSMRNGHVQIMPPKMYWTQDNKPTVSSTASSVKVSTCQDSVEQMTDCAQYLILEPSQEYYGDTFLANGQSLRNERKRSSLHLKTHNPETLPLPHPELLEIQAKLGQALLNFFTEQLVKTNGAILSESDPSNFWSRPFQLLFRRLWHLVPFFIRAKGYQYLFRSAAMYGSMSVYELPLGLFAKRCDRSDDNEPAALALLEKYAPDVPAPLLIDKFQDLDNVKWMISTKLPGTVTMATIFRMSYPQRREFVRDLAAVIKQINDIPNNTGRLICGAGGGRIYDWRCAMANGCGPFDTEEAFCRHLSRDSYIEDAIPSAFDTKHRSVFTHSDLHTCNILVHNGRLTGIVDWESSGFMPEYWDFTKAMRTAKNKDEIDMYRKIWGHKYDHELEVEKYLWQGCPLGGPDELEHERVALPPTNWPLARFHALIEP